MYRYIALLTYLCIVYVSQTMPIGPSEVVYYYEKTDAVHYLMHLFEGNERLPFLLLSTVNFILFYKLSKFYLESHSDRYVALSMFMLLPGIVSSAILADQSSLGIFAVLSFLLAYKHGHKPLQIAMLLLLFFVHQTSVIFFFSLFFYAIYRRKEYLIVTSLLLFSVGMYVYGYAVEGRPSGHFVELFGLYAVVFSPLVFLYFLYSLYRSALDRKIDIMWFIAVISLLLSMLLSFRQYISIEQFAPFVVVAIVITVQVFSRSYRVRLREFRKRYKRMFLFIFVTLVINSALLLQHKVLFHFIEPKNHFAFRFYQPKALSEALKENRIPCVHTSSKKLQYQLRYYGIERCSEYILHSYPLQDTKKIDVYYENMYFGTKYVSKINTFAY